MPEIHIKITDKNRFRKGARVILFFCLTLFIGFVLFSFVVFLFLNKYLKSESFKISLENRINNELEVSSNFDEFRWQGTTVDTDQLKAEGYEGAIFSKLRADGIRARVNIGAVKRRTWEVTGLDINRINLLIDSNRLTDAGENLGDTKGQELDSQDNGFLKRFLPKRSKITKIGPECTEGIDFRCFSMPFGLPFSVKFLDPPKPLVLRQVSHQSLVFTFQRLPFWHANWSIKSKI